MTFIVNWAICALFFGVLFFTGFALAWLEDRFGLPAPLVAIFLLITTVGAALMTWVPK